MSSRLRARKILQQVVNIKRTSSKQNNQNITTVSNNYNNIIITIIAFLIDLLLFKKTAETPQNRSFSQFENPTAENLEQVLLDFKVCIL